MTSGEAPCMTMRLNGLSDLFIDPQELSFIRIVRGHMISFQIVIRELFFRQLKWFVSASAGHLIQPIVLKKETE
jgi:hypothetical protein